MNVHELELHQEHKFTTKGCGHAYWVMRVPGGWIYSDRTGSMCFVPLSGEYREEK